VAEKRNQITTNTAEKSKQITINIPATALFDLCEEDFVRLFLDGLAVDLYDEKINIWIKFFIEDGLERSFSFDKLINTMIEDGAPSETLSRLADKFDLLSRKLRQQGPSN
jgi:hypothetical protein